MDKSKQASLLYDKIAELYSREFSTPSEYIDEFLELIPGNGKILDAGCGPGVDSGYMKARGFEVLGVDLSEEMLKIAKQKFPKIHFELADLRALKLKPNSFDGILASCSLIHIPKKDIIPTLQNFNKFLKRDGKIYIALQAGKSGEIFINEPFKPDEKLFLNIISIDEIKDLLFKTGFSIVKKYERKPKSKEELNFTKLFIIAKKI
ncbi:hypothetical protein A3K64_04185 [Candidatus Micrarchaeota archaeon RBG_16_36_9]|nr:MAG: hypothetical protein A3K64_04185 [Candidatus Micrarchaeota archaeon RBG_16_36_9]